MPRSFGNARCPGQRECPRGMGSLHSVAGPRPSARIGASIRAGRLRSDVCDRGNSKDIQTVVVDCTRVSWLRLRRRLVNTGRSRRDVTQDRKTDTSRRCSGVFGAPKEVLFHGPARFIAAPGTTRRHPCERRPAWRRHRARPRCRCGQPRLKGTSAGPGRTPRRPPWAFQLPARLLRRRTWFQRGTSEAPAGK